LFCVIIFFFFFFLNRIWHSGSHFRLHNYSNNKEHVKSWVFCKYKLRCICQNVGKFMSSASRFNSSHEAIRCLLTRISNILQFTTDHLSMIKLQSKDYSTHLTDLALRAKVSRSPLIITVLNGFSSWTLFECKTQGFWGIQTLPNH
jgi:hypothetical protein